MSKKRRPFTDESEARGALGALSGEHALAQLASMPDNVRATLEIPPDPAFACPAANLAGALAARAGVGQRECMRFQLTVEEFCICLAGLTEGLEPLRLVLTGKRHQLRAAFSFVAAHLSLGALNITAGQQVMTLEENADALGLLLAGKAADRFRLRHLGGDCFELEAEVDKIYPPAVPVHAPNALRLPLRPCIAPDRARLTQAAALAAAAYPPWQCPQSFRTPEQFADMTADGDVACVLICDAGGQTAGLMTWRPCSARALYFSGPFLFVPPDAAPGMAEAVARQLLEDFLAAVARESYDIVLSFRPTAELPRSAFEPLGELQICAADNLIQQPVVFRHLREDNGLAVWCSPCMEDFLRQTYDLLALPRDILPVTEPCTRPRRASLLGASVDQVRSLGELEPFLDGDDLATNLAAHVTALQAKGIRTILYSMDLAVPWEAAQAGELRRAGFVPKVLLPQGGQADKVIWQHEQPA
ncbi:hypothetical protein [Megalodesulfovibrio gigas]|nr:hypothetical protein [Megalodesulfovibrio gigas]